MSLVEDLRADVVRVLERARGHGVRFVANNVLAPGDVVDPGDIVLACSECGSEALEEWGESGEFWIHCWSCGTDF